MEFVSLAVVLGSVGVSTYVSTKTEQIVDSIDNQIKLSMGPKDRMVVDKTTEVKRAEKATQVPATDR